MTKKRARPAKKEKDETKVTKAEATQVFIEERQRRVAVVQAGMQALLRDQNCALDMEIVLNSQGVKSSSIQIVPLADQG